MDLKKSLENRFKDKDILYKYRLKTSEIFFVFSSILFFTNLFLLWNKFQEIFFAKTFIFTYIMFITSLCFYLYFLITKHFSKKYKLLVSIILIILYLIFILSFSWLPI